MRTDTHSLTAFIKVHISLAHNCTPFRNRPASVQPRKTHPDLWAICFCFAPQYGHQACLLFKDGLFCFCFFLTLGGGWRNTRHWNQEITNRGIFIYCTFIDPTLEKREMTAWYPGQAQYVIEVISHERLALAAFQSLSWSLHFIKVDFSSPTQHCFIFQHTFSSLNEYTTFWEVLSFAFSPRVA